MDGHTGKKRLQTEGLLCNTDTPLPETCCCNHGGRCTCCPMKEQLEPVLESDSEHETTPVASVPRSKIAARRRRANTVHSDSVHALDQRLASKHGRCGQKVGPYQLNRTNSANSTNSVGSSADNLLHRATEGSRECPKEPRRVKSEAASPLFTANSFGTGNGNLPHLDLSNIDYPSYMANSTYDPYGSGLPDGDAPIYSAGLSAASVDWSGFDWPNASRDDFAPSSYSQGAAQSYNGMFEFGSGSEQLPRLANTTSTSGDVSEVEDFMAGAEGDFEGFGSGNGFLRQGLLDSPADLSSIDYTNFYKSTEPAPMVGSGMSMVEDDPAFWIANYKNENMAVDENPEVLGAPQGVNPWDT